MRLCTERWGFPISANRDLLSALVIKYHVRRLEQILVIVCSQRCALVLLYQSALSAALTAGADFQGVGNGVFVSSRNRELRVSSFSYTESSSTA